MTPLTPICLCSLDSLFAGILLGPFIATRSRRLRMALAFGLCDAAGTALAQGPGLRWVDGPGPLVLLAIAAIAIGAVAGAQARQRVWAGALPVAMAFDNACSPAAASAPLAGLASAALAAAGLALGAWAWRLAQHRGGVRAWV